MTRQILVNLVLNAVQAHAEPSTVNVEVRTGQDNGFLWCSVQDNGPGVPAERAESIFKPFITTKTRGTGLGLAVSRRLAELQGGHLVLENPGESGARFRFTVPVSGQPA
jgi:signal transduction histidine kinase